MEFCYAAVLRGDVPLAQFCPISGNFDLFFQKLYEKDTLKPGRTIILSEGYHWGIQLESSGLTFLCVVRQPRDQSVLDRTLDDIKSRFLRLHSSDWQNAAPFALQTSFETQLELVKQSVQAVYRTPLVANEDLEVTDQDELLGEPHVTTPKEPKDKKTVILFAAGLLAVAVIVVYLILALACGGWNLQPRCIKPTDE